MEVRRLMVTLCTIFNPYLSSCNCIKLSNDIMRSSNEGVENEAERNWFCNTVANERYRFSN